MRLTANRNMKYGGKVIVAGNEFEASERDGRLLVAIRRASLAEPQKGTAAKKKRAGYNRRDMVAGDVNDGLLQEPTATDEETGP